MVLHFHKYVLVEQGLFVLLVLVLLLVLQMV